MSYGGRIESFFTVPSGITMSATTTSGGPTSIPITAGTYTITSYSAMVQSQLNATRTPANWVVTVSTGSNGTGLVTINNPGTTWALTFTSAPSGTVMGFVGNIASGAVAVTGTRNAVGLYLPKCPLQIEGDPDVAPEMTDMRSVESPWGKTTSYKNTRSYAHEQLVYSHVTRDRAHEASATTPSSSFQQWLRDTQWGDGHAWFSVGSAFQIYWDNVGTDRIVGYELNTNTGPTNGWTFSPPIGKLTDHVKMASKPWLGMWSISLPRVVSEG